MKSTNTRPFSVALPFYEATAVETMPDGEHFDFEVQIMDEELQITRSHQCSGAQAAMDLEGGLAAVARPDHDRREGCAQSLHSS